MPVLGSPRCVSPPRPCLFGRYFAADCSGFSGQKSRHQEPTVTDDDTRLARAVPTLLHSTYQTHGFPCGDLSRYNFSAHHTIAYLGMPHASVGRGEGSRIPICSLQSSPFCCNCTEGRPLRTCSRDSEPCFTSKERCWLPSARLAAPRVLVDSCFQF